tara:strand:- start:18422 stop:18625 length:204 start_codon:yes stop_codon:yes gene_type:complete
MDAKVVFSVANSLPEKEFVSLYLMLKEKIDAHNKVLKKQKFTPPISNVEAVEYLLKNVFGKKKIIKQ